MARSSDPLRLALASLACAALVAAPLPPVVRVVGALPLVLYLPGRCWLAAVFPGNAIDGETRALSAALSLALVILIGVGLARVMPLGPQVWLAVLPTMCVAACGLAAIRGRGTRTFEPVAPRPPLGAWHICSLLAAIGVASLAYMEASRGALNQHPDLYTDFWVVPEAGQAPTVATAGVKNQEGRDAVYAIDVVARGAVVERREAFRLHPGETRVIRVALPRVAFTPAGTQPPTDGRGGSQANGLRTLDDVLGANRVELRLFKGGNRNTAYRRVWIALPAPVVDNVAMAEPDLPAGNLSYSGSALNTLRASLVAEPKLGSTALPHDPARGLQGGPVAADALELSQAAALQAPTLDARAQEFGVAREDPTSGLRSPRFAPDAAAAPATSHSPD